MTTIFISSIQFFPKPTKFCGPWQGTNFDHRIWFKFDASDVVVVRFQLNVKDLDSNHYDPKVGRGWPWWQDEADDLGTKILIYICIVISCLQLPRG
jgi:hypothetical protein